MLKRDGERWSGSAGFEVNDFPREPPSPQPYAAARMTATADTLTETASPPLNVEDPVAHERERCVSILRQRAKAFERQKLFNLARALSAAARDICAKDEGAL